MGEFKAPDHRKNDTLALARTYADAVTFGSYEQNALLIDRALQAERHAVQTIRVKYDPNNPTFGLVGEPHDHRRHPNERLGLDRAVHVINFDTGEACHKKLYENKLGLYFKHTGYPTMYLSDFTADGEVVPFQLKLPTEPTPTLKQLAGE